MTTSARPIEAAIVARAKALLVEKKKEAESSVKSWEQSAERARDEVTQIQDLIDGLKDDDFIPEGWLSPEQAAETRKVFENTITALKAGTEKHEATLAAIIEQKNAEVTKYKDEIVRINERQRAALEDEQIAHQKYVTALHSKARADLDNMEKTYKQATEMLRVGCDAEIARVKDEATDAENDIKVIERERDEARAVANRADEMIMDLENKVDAYERDFRQIRDTFQKHGFNCGNDSADVVALTDSVIRIAALARDNPPTQTSKRSRFRDAVVYALGELLR